MDWFENSFEMPLENRSIEYFALFFSIVLYSSRFISVSLSLILPVSRLIWLWNHFFPEIDVRIFQWWMFLFTVTAIRRFTNGKMKLTAMLYVGP